jgi:hypothetical protein
VHIGEAAPDEAPKNPNNTIPEDAILVNEEEEENQQELQSVKNAPPMHGPVQFALDCPAEPYRPTRMRSKQASMHEHQQSGWF